MFAKLNRIPTILSALALTAVLGACDNPVETDDDHIDDAVGVVLTDLAGTTIAEMHEDHWDFASGAEALQLQVGDELEVRVFFVAEDGDRFQLPDTGAEHTLRVAVASPAVVEYEGHGDHGDFVALAAGATTVEFQVFHGGHADWSSEPMPVVVTE